MKFSGNENNRAKEKMMTVWLCYGFQRDFDLWSPNDQIQVASIIKQLTISCNLVLLLPTLLVWVNLDICKLNNLQERNTTQINHYHHRLASLSPRDFLGGCFFIASKNVLCLHHKHCIWRVEKNIENLVFWPELMKNQN